MTNGFLISGHGLAHSWRTTPPLSSPTLHFRSPSLPPLYFRGFKLPPWEKYAVRWGQNMITIESTFALRKFGLKYLPKKAQLTAQGAESLWTGSRGTWPCNIAKIFSKTSDPTCIYSEGWNEIKESYRWINMYERCQTGPAVAEHII